MQVRVTNRQNWCKSLQCRSFFLLLIAVIMNSCSPRNGETLPTGFSEVTPPPSLIELEKAAFFESRGKLGTFRAKVRITVDGVTSFEGEMHLSPNLEYLQFVSDSGPTISLSGEGVWEFPPFGPFDKLRQDLLTLGFLLSLPVRSDQRGFEFTPDRQTHTIRGRLYDKTYLSFTTEAVNAPAAFYTLYLNPSDKQVRALSAQTSLFTSSGEAEELLFFFEQYDEQSNVATRITGFVPEDIEYLQPKVIISLSDIELSK